MRLLLGAFFLPIVASFCPDGYDLAFAGICTLFTRMKEHHSQLHIDAVNLCSPNGATPVLIKSQEEHDLWVAQITWYSIALGIRCNNVTSSWEWDDGSRIEYKPPSYASFLDGTCSGTTSWWMTKNGQWTYGQDTSSDTFDIYCMKTLPRIVLQDQECNDFSDDSENSVCFEVGMEPMSWLDAQAVCKSVGANIVSIHNAQENSFVRRLAVSRGQVNGVFLGASIVGKGDNFSWIDGSAWDYQNFFPGFPFAGAGGCVAMDTNNPEGQWLNTDCGDKMPFVCARKPEDLEPSCSGQALSEGDIVYSPGFPSNAYTPCDYFLTVPSGKRVEVEILLLEANSCCDKLVLSEGSLGGNVIATVTGDVSRGTKYATNSSNIMRASWQPNCGVNVRGVMMTFRGV